MTKYNDEYHGISTIYENENLKDYLNRCNFSDEFANDHLIPMSSAIWSCPEKEILTFPAKNLLTFFKNHQLINFFIRPQWRTVKGGSIQYVKKVIKSIEQNKKNKLFTHYIINNKKNSSRKMV